MYPAGLYLVRPAGAHDAQALHRLSTLDSGRPLRRPVIVGEMDGELAAAISLADGRSLADPDRAPGPLRAYLQMRAGATRRLAAEPALRDRLLGAIPARLGGRA